MIYSSTENREDYIPPILGNGEITFGASCEGTFSHTQSDFNGILTFEGCLFRAGRRLCVTHDRGKGDILSFGRLSFDTGSKLSDWTQELIPEYGLQKSVCRYDSGVEISSEYFIHPSENIYALRKRTAKGKTKFSYTYSFVGHSHTVDEAIIEFGAKKSGNGAEITFTMLGQDKYTGIIRIFLDSECDIEIKGRSVTLSRSVKENESVSVFLCIEDDLYGKKTFDEIERMNIKALNDGFDGLLSECLASWGEYYENGYAITGDSVLDHSYKTALYNLRCYATRWSIPVGINNASWDGKFFAFDEYYGFLGLLGANRLCLAKRVPEFRLRACLDKAIKRINQFGAPMARFAWETGEYGEELSPPGFWYEHVFHMALTALGAFEFYEHSNDKDFLSECYRMIRACAKFYTRFMIYSDLNGRLYVGKCTDLERLGEAVENPFMTSCGVIRTLETLVKAADILDIDKEYRDECEKTALKLRESLPENDGRFVPYAGCPQKSIAVFAGKFPFDVIKNDDERLLSAWDDFIVSENKYGNMYIGGSHVSSWYACWKAEGYARVGKGQEAYSCAKQALESAGVFGEMFEINEPGKRLRPWFTTASGIFLSTINEMLLQSDGKNVYILPAFPDLGKDISFKLSVKGGAVAEVYISGGKIKKLALTMKKGIRPKAFKVYFKKDIFGEITAEPAKGFKAPYTY